MNTTLEDWLRATVALTASVMTMLLSCASGGCIYTLSGDGEMGFKQETRWVFFHETKLNEQGEKKSTMEMRGSFFDWAMDQADAPATAPDLGDDE